MGLEGREHQGAPTALACLDGFGRLNRIMVVLRWPVTSRRLSRTIVARAPAFRVSAVASSVGPGPRWLRPAWCPEVPRPPATGRPPRAADGVGVWQGVDGLTEVVHSLGARSGRRPSDPGATPQLLDLPERPLQRVPRRPQHAGRLLQLGGRPTGAHRFHPAVLLQFLDGEKDAVGVGD